MSGPTPSTRDAVLAAEDALRRAMLDSDVDALERLLAPDLVFVNHLGAVMTRDDDLEAHATGAVAIDRLELSDVTVREVGDGAAVTAQATIAGTFGGAPGSGTFRFLRVWVRDEHDAWRVTVAQSTLVAG